MEHQHSSSTEQHERPPLSNTGSLRLDWLQVGIYQSELNELEHYKNLCNELKLLIPPWDDLEVWHSSGQTFWYKDCIHISHNKTEVIQLLRWPNTEKQPFLMICFNGSFFNLLSINRSNNIDKNDICTESYINELISLKKIQKKRISRVDIALDILNSDITPYDVEQIYLKGGFSRRGGNPISKIIGPCRDENRESSEGSTLYLGRPDGDYRITFYEKGKQLKLHKEFPKWNRCEVKLKGKRKEIPWDILDNPLPYYRKTIGEVLYEVFKQNNYLNESADPACIPLKTRSVKDNELELTRHCKKMYGGLIYYFKQNGLSDSEIIQRLIKPKLPKSLIERKEILWH